MLVSLDRKNGAIRRNEPKVRSVEFKPPESVVYQHMVIWAHDNDVGCVVDVERCPLLRNCCFGNNRVDFSESRNVVNLAIEPSAPHVDPWYRTIRSAQLATVVWQR